MKATLPAENTSNGRNLFDEKQMTMCIVIVDKKTKREVVKAVVWHGRTKGANYATVWANGNGRHIAGHGRATGYGYHRPSAALSKAFESAGVKLSQSIDAVGAQAMREACEALAAALGTLRGRQIVVEI